MVKLPGGDQTMLLMGETPGGNDGGEIEWGAEETMAELVFGTSEFKAPSTPLETRCGRNDMHHSPAGMRADDRKPLVQESCSNQVRHA